LEDRRISAKSIAEQLGMSRERVGSVIHEGLDMRKVTKGVLFLHDNAPAHREIATEKKLAYLSFQYLDHPPYSPDLAPLDYHLFPGLKKQLKGRRFSSDAEVMLPRRPGWTHNLLNFF
jgi:transposase